MNPKLWKQRGFLLNPFRFGVVGPTGSPVDMMINAISHTSTANISFPASTGTVKGNLAVLLDIAIAASGGATPTKVIPSGFTEVRSEAFSYSTVNGRITISYMIVPDSALAGTSITGQTGGTGGTMSKSLRVARTVSGDELKFVNLVDTIYGSAVPGTTPLSASITPSTEVVPTCIIGVTRATSGAPTAATINGTAMTVNTGNGHSALFLNKTTAPSGTLTLSATRTSPGAYFVEMVGVFHCFTI